LTARNRRTAAVSPWANAALRTAEPLLIAQGVVVRLTDRRCDVIAVVKAPLKDPSHDIGAQVAAEKMAAHHHVIRASAHAVN
jgi:hypothetical protein